MKPKRFFLIGLFVLILIGLFININDYKKGVVKKDNLLAVTYDENNCLATFDSNSGVLYGFNDGNSKLTEQVGSTEVYCFNFPTMSIKIKDSNRNGKYILYWSRSSDCSTNDLAVGTEKTATGNKYYIACYEEKKFDNNGIRYVGNNAYVSGKNVSCGDKIRITSCYKVKNGSAFEDRCDFDQINGTSATGTVKRDNIVEGKSAAVCSSSSTTYRAKFDKNYGKLVGFDGVSGVDKIEEGVYGLKESVKISGVENSNRDGKYILYWSTTNDCSKDLAVGNESAATGNKYYIACYEEKKFDNNGIRYVGDNAYVSGKNVSCGDKIRITSCYKKKDGSNFVEYCDFDQINGTTASGVVYRSQIVEGKSAAVCTNEYTAYFHESSEDIKGYGMDTVDSLIWHTNGIIVGKGITIPTPNTSSLVSTTNNKKFIGWSADDDGKNVNCSGKLVTGDSVTLTSDVHYYACYEQDEKCVNSEKILNGKGSYEVKVCYETYTDASNEVHVKPKTEDYNDILKCSDGYTLNKVSKTNIIQTTCTSAAEGDCYRIFNLSCMGERPKVSASVATVDGEYGTIKFNGISSVGIKGYYASRYYDKPTINSEWVYESGGKYTLSATPGSMFLWVIDDNDQISYAVMTSVIDKINVDTTLRNLEVKSNDGETLNTTKYSYDNSFNDIVSNDYMLLSNSSSINSELLANSFNPFDTAYTVKTSSDKIAVYATLTSEDASYVSGYEPRTVDLDYGVNTILIKIKNKKGIERTYTIIVTREDDRDATNYLKSLTVSEGKLKFDRYNTDYVVSVGKNKKTVNINGELSSLNASFVDGYGPRTINLINESTTAAIKIKSETGSIRSYVITFVKSGEDVSESKDLMLSSLSLSKAYVAFDKKVSDYNTTVDYEIDSIDIYALAENGGDSVTLYKSNKGVTEKIESKEIKLNVGDNNITIIVSNHKGQSRTYNINIVRKENGLDISSDNTLSLLDVHGYDIGFDPEVLDYQIKIKREKTLLIAATPKNNRAEVYIRGNDNLTAFSIVKIKVVSEDGQYREYTIDIKKDTVNKTIELIAIISGVVIIICGIIVIRVKKNRKSVNDYYA